MRGYENYERACGRIEVPYDQSIKRFIRFLEFDGYTEKGICNAIRIGRAKLRKPMEKPDFYNVLLECVKEYAWSDDDPRWEIIEARRKKNLKKKIEKQLKQQEEKQEEKQDFKEKILTKSYTAGHPKGFIYFLQSQTNSQIKIGYTANIHQRIKNLQYQKKDKLELLAAAPGDYDYEAHLHRLFKQHNIEGEWFNPDPEIFQYIDRLINLNKPKNETDKQRFIEKLNKR